jgi:hypothetical protein
MTQATPRGVWLGASARLSRPVTLDEPYPHVCRPDATPQAQRRDCAACAEQGPPLRDPNYDAEGYRRLPRADFYARTGGRYPEDARD